MNQQVQRRLNQLGGHRADGDGNSIKSRRERLREELRELISEHESGVWSVDLMDAYKTKYNKRLEYNKYGYDCIITLCSHMEDVFRIERPKPYGDWLLIDVTRPDWPIRSESPAKSESDTEQYTEEVTYTEEDALPGIPYDASVLPPDCVNFNEPDPFPKQPVLEVGSTLEITVQEIGDPSHFWFRLLDEASKEAFNAVEDEMELYYRAGEGAERRLDLGAQREGQYVVAMYEGRTWHRAVIVQELSDQEVKIRYIDYGMVARVKAETLRYFIKSLSVYPPLVFRGRLAYLKPAWNSAKWPLSVSDKFLELTKSKVHARICNIDGDEQIYSLDIVDKTANGDIFISEELEKLHYAEITNENVLEDGITPTYYYPTFEALETGRALNYLEKRMLEDLGQCTDYIDVFVNHQPRTKPKTTEKLDNIEAPKKSNKQETSSCSKKDSVNANESQNAEFLAVNNNPNAFPESATLNYSRAQVNSLTSKCSNSNPVQPPIYPPEPYAFVRLEGQNNHSNRPEQQLNSMPTNYQPTRYQNHQLPEVQTHTNISLQPQHYNQPFSTLRQNPQMLPFQPLASSSSNNSFPSNSHDLTQPHYQLPAHKTPLLFQPQPQYQPSQIVEPNPQNFPFQPLASTSSNNSFPSNSLDLPQPHYQLPAHKTSPLLKPQHQYQPSQIIARNPQMLPFQPLASSSSSNSFPSNSHDLTQPHYQLQMLQVPLTLQPQFQYQPSQTHIQNPQMLPFQPLSRSASNNYLSPESPVSPQFDATLQVIKALLEKEPSEAMKYVDAQIKLVRNAP